MTKYKGYSAALRIDLDDDKIYGRIAGIRDIVHFEGRSLDEVKRNFEDAVDGYLEACEHFKKAPQRPHSGKLNLRMPPDICEQLAAAADLAGHSLNEHIVQTLRKSLG